MDRKIGLGLLASLAVVAGIAAAAIFVVGADKSAAGLEKLDSFVDSLQPRMRLDYAAAEADRSGAVTVRDLTVTGDRIGSVAIREMVLREYDTENPAPHRVDMTLKGVDLPLDGSLRETAAALGYQRLELDLDYAYSYTAEDRSLELTGISMTVPEAGALTIRARLGNVDVVDPAVEGIDMQALMQLMLQGGEIVYRDDSLVDRLIGLRARKIGVSAEAFRADIISRIDGEIARAEGESGRELLRAVRSFIEKPGELRLTIAPEQPVAAIELLMLQSDPEAAQRVLGLTITAN